MTNYNKAINNYCCFFKYFSNTTRISLRSIDLSPIKKEKNTAIIIDKKINNIEFMLDIETYFFNT